MSFKRLNTKAGDLGMRLVDDDLDAIGTPLNETTTSAAAAASGSASRNPSMSPAAAAVASPSGVAVYPAAGSKAHSRRSPTSSASRNQPMNSSLAGGERDMELIELNPYRGGAAGDEELRDREDASDSAPRSSPLSDEENGSDERLPGNGEGAVHSPRPARQWPSVLRDGWRAYLLRSFREFFLSAKLNILLLAVPIAIVCKIGGWGDGPLFVFSLIGLCPLAERISFVTDEMAMYTNDTIGGLLSATMGNVTELIVSFFALQKGLLRVVQLSLIGSVFSNLLLVQGTAFLVGGLKYSQQKYSQAAAKTNVSLLLLASMGLMFPMVLIGSDSLQSVTSADSLSLQGTGLTAASALANATHVVEESSGEGITPLNALKLSRFASAFLLLIYALLIVYQLKTHAHLFESREEEDDDDDSEPEPPILGPAGSIVWAVIVTIFISILSEFIVSAIDGAAEAIGLPVLFSATILLPIVGNAAEHASAIIFAQRDKMDIAIGISVGSSTQIALFVIPLMVILGWASGQPLSLNFQAFETVSLFATIVLTSVVFSSGKSDWLYGAMMIVGYMIIAAAFWWQKQPADLK